MRKVFWYDFERNFNLPYISQNVTGFWRRWHISLSTWLKEYLYIPLGGNRKGKIRQYVNLFITMLLGGLWHGANWTFVFWGALNGIALCFDKMLKHNKSKTIIKISMNIFITYCFITFTWIFFRAENFMIAWEVIKGIITMQNGVVHNFFWSYLSIIIMILATLSAVIKAKKTNSDIIKWLLSNSKFK